MFALVLPKVSRKLKTYEFLIRTKLDYSTTRGI